MRGPDRTGRALSDARFEDADERPLRLLARSGEDLVVLSALAQDAVLTGTDIRWQTGRRRLVLLINRFRWEDRAATEGTQRPPERVRALLTVHDVTAVASNGVDRSDPHTVLSLLGLGFEAGPDGTGTLILTLAGDGAIRAQVECLDVALCDVTRPYLAPSGRVPRHPD